MTVTPQMRLHRAAAAYTEACGQEPNEAALKHALAATEGIQPDGRPGYQAGDVLRYPHGDVIVITRVRDGANPAIFYEGLSGRSSGAYLGPGCHQRCREAWGAPIGHMRVNGALKLAARKDARAQRLTENMQHIARIASRA